MVYLFTTWKPSIRIDKFEYRVVEILISTCINNNNTLTYYTYTPVNLEKCSEFEKGGCGVCYRL